MYRKMKIDIYLDSGGDSTSEKAGDAAGSEDEYCIDIIFTYVYTYAYLHAHLPRPPLSLSMYTHRHIYIHKINSMRLTWIPEEMPPARRTVTQLVPKSIIIYILNIHTYIYIYYIHTRTER